MLHITHKGRHLYSYIHCRLNSFNSGNCQTDSSEQAMLTNGASVEVLRQNSLSSSDETSPYTPLVLELLLWLTVGWPLTCQPRQNDLCVFCRTYTSVESLALAGPIIRPSSSTIASLHDITGSFTSCYKSHRLQTRLRLLQNVVLSTVYTVQDVV